MIKITDRSQCSGCTACASICKINAIDMKPDKLGFLYPEVDLSKCVDCGICEKVCSFNDSYETENNFTTPLLFAARQTDINQVKKSRSGGIFAALSDIILENGGVVYGAGYDTSFRVIHKRVTDKIGREELRGSKYVQSDVSGIFRQIVKDLKDKRIVLFSGTPCQVSGLKSLFTFYSY